MAGRQRNIAIARTVGWLGAFIRLDATESHPNPESESELPQQPQYSYKYTIPVGCASIKRPTSVESTHPPPVLTPWSSEEALMVVVVLEPMLLVTLDGLSLGIRAAAGCIN